MVAICHGCHVAGRRVRNAKARCGVCLDINRGAHLFDLQLQRFLHYSHTSAAAADLRIGLAPDEKPYDARLILDVRTYSGTDTDTDTTDISSPSTTTTTGAAARTPTTTWKRYHRITQDDSAPRSSDSDMWRRDCVIRLQRQLHTPHSSPHSALNVPPTSLQPSASNGLVESFNIWVVFDASCEKWGDAPAVSSPGVIPVVPAEIHMELARGNGAGGGAEGASSTPIHAIGSCRAVIYYDHTGRIRDGFGNGGALARYQRESKRGSSATSSTTLEDVIFDPGSTTTATSVLYDSRKNGSIYEALRTIVTSPSVYLNPFSFNDPDGDHDPRAPSRVTKPMVLLKYLYPPNITFFREGGGGESHRGSGNGLAESQAAPAAAAFVTHQRQRRGNGLISGGGDSSRSSATWYARTSSALSKRKRVSSAGDETNFKSGVALAEPPVDDGGGVTR